MNHRNFIGQRIRHYRELNSLSQKELGAKLGVASKYISNVEGGHVGISLEKLINISVLLGVHIPDLLPSDEMRYMSQKERWISEISETLREWEPTRICFLKTMVCGKGKRPPKTVKTTVLAAPSKSCKTS